MKAFKYTLDKSSKKFMCPGCHKKTLVKFIDIENNYAPERFGRCDREDRCGYFIKPDDADDYIFIPRSIIEDKPTSYIPKEYAIGTLKDYQLNPLIKYLISKFGESKVMELIAKYRIGIDDTSSFTKDWVIFWQFDKDNNIRSGKMIKYNDQGKRCKDVSSTWYHKKHLNGQPLFTDFNLKQCLFGEHLIPTATKPIAIVESEKTALIASIHLDKHLWVACGGLNQLSASKMEILRNRSVTLFPDLGCFGEVGEFYRDNETNLFYIRDKNHWIPYNQTPDIFKTGNGPPLSAFEKWKVKAKEFEFNISDHIERIATDEDRLKGLDIADFLLR